MNIFILSEFYSNSSNQNSVCFGFNYVFERILADTCNATIIYPESNDRIGLYNRCKNRIFKSWFKFEELPILKDKPNILLVIGLGPQHLLAMSSLGNLLEKFDLRLAYLIDIFDPRHIDSSVIPYLDHILVTIPELVDETNQFISEKSSFMPLGTDVLKYGSNSLHRCIDIINYGRGNPKIHQSLQLHFNQLNSNHLYFHSTFDTSQVYNLQEHILLLNKLLSKSKISLCFEPSQISRFRGYSPLTFRWFEGWAAGCTIVGKKPFSKGTNELMDWENSTIEIPENPSEWIPFFEELLGDQETLLANSQRNYRECLLRHDLRYRIKDIFDIVGLPIPSRLNDEIKYLKQKGIQ